MSDSSVQTVSGAFDANSTTVPVRSGGPQAEKPRSLGSALGPSDRVFRGIAGGAGITVLLIMSLVGLFLTFRALQAIGVAGFSFFTVQEWQPDSGKGHFGVAAILVGTALIAMVAVTVAVPLATCTSLYISEYAPASIKRTLVSTVDLMAAVPSVVFGLWGFFLLQPNITGLSRWISTHFGWIPFLSVDGFVPDDPLSSETVFTSSTFIAGITVGLMITPLLTSIMREAFTQAPVGEREGSYALGSTKWGMIRSVVLPFGKGAMIGGTMLGLGRALGETITVFMIISPIFAIQPHILQNGGSSVSLLIALQYGEATPFATSALMAAGLALFLITLAVNFLASSIVARSRSGAASDS